MWLHICLRYIYRNTNTESSSVPIGHNINKTQKVYEIYKDYDTVLEVMAILENIFYLLQQTAEKSESKFIAQKVKCNFGSKPKRSITIVTESPNTWQIALCKDKLNMG